MLTFIDGEPLKADLLLRGSTVNEIMGHWPLRGRYLVFHICLYAFSNLDGELGLGEH